MLINADVDKVWPQLDSIGKSVFEVLIFAVLQMLFNILIAAIFLSVSILGMIYSPVWWDEGWSLAVAKNYLLFDHYGQINDGILFDRGLAQRFPIIFPIICSFKLFGIGIWPARLPFLLYSLGFFINIYYLTSQLFGKRTAKLNIVLLLLYGFSIHTLIMNIQVLGEVPLLFFLSAGFLFSLRSESSKTSRNLNLLAAVTMFFLAIFSKPQVMPFLMVAFLSSAILAYFHRKYFETAKFLCLSILPICLFVLFGYLNKLLSFFPSENTAAMPGLITTVLINFDSFSRLQSILNVAYFGLPIIAAIIYFLAVNLPVFKSHNKSATELNIDCNKVAICLMCLSWYGWFVSLSQGWYRYLYPAAVFSLMFVAWFINYTGFSFNYKKSRFSLKAWVFIYLLMPPIFLNAVVQSWQNVATKLSNESNVNLLEVTEFINSRNDNSPIETYESELFFLLKKPYHFPPDSFNLEVLRKLSDPDVKYTNFWDYKKYPLLIVGPFDRQFKFYINSKETIATSKIIFKNASYTVYMRND